MPPEVLFLEPSIKSEREIFEIEVGIGSSRGKRRERVIKHLTQLGVAFFHRDPNTFAKKPCVDKGTAAKAATVPSILTFEPQAERYSVAENCVDFAFNEGLAQQLLGFVGFADCIWKKPFEIGFMRAPCLDADGFFAQAFRRRRPRPPLAFSDAKRAGVV